MSYFIRLYYKLIYKIYVYVKKEISEKRERGRERGIKNETCARYPSSYNIDAIFIILLYATINVYTIAIRIIAISNTSRGSS